MISVQNLHKSFGKKKVLQGISFDVPKGKSLVLLGGSGTGKSVTLKCLLGLLHPDKGMLTVDGIDVTKSEGNRALARQKIGMLFQGSALFDSLSVWENIFFGLLQTQAIHRQEAMEKAPELLRAVGLNADVAFLYPAALSGGMQRRVGLARAVASRPPILFFDEPTAGLDPIISGVINDLVTQNVKELGATAITITHDLRSAKSIADDVALIHQGHLVWKGPVKELETCDNPYVHQFIRGLTQGPIAVEGR